MRIIILGSTGLVGGHILRLALSDSRFTSIITPTRKITFTHAKLFSPVVDFEHLPENADWWKADAILCALGTTMKIAGSREAFARVDRDYPIMAAKIGIKQGVRTFVLNSAHGADVNSHFYYNRIKGQVEQGLRDLNFESFTTVRPGLISGNRKEFRLAERLGIHLLKTFNPILPKSLRLNPAEMIAKKMIEAAVFAPKGFHIISSRELISKET